MQTPDKRKASFWASESKFSGEAEKIQKPQHFNAKPQYSFLYKPRLRELCARQSESTSIEVPLRNGILL